MIHKNRINLVLDIVRVGVAIGVVVMLLVLYRNINDLGSASIYAASWVTFLHVCIGEFALIRYLHARSRVQNILDLLAGVFLVAGLASFTSPALWCAFLGGLFALAVTKYLLVEKTTRDPAVKQYARDKIHWESPAVVGLAVLAIVLDHLPPASTAAHLLQVIILVATTGFAIWMIAIRHAYSRLRDRDKNSADAPSASSQITVHQTADQSPPANPAPVKANAEHKR